MEQQPLRLSVEDQRADERRQVDLLVAAAGELVTPQVLEQAREAYMSDMPYGD